MLDLPIGGRVYLSSELDIDISILTRMERLFVFVQEQMEYLKCQNSNIDTNINSFKEKLNEVYEGVLK